MKSDKIIANKIACEYIKKESSKIIALKKLDKKAKMPAYIFSYIFGITCVLIFGTGMCLCLGVLIEKSLTAYAVGITLGIVGIVGVSVNYLIYNLLLKKGKEKYGSDILLLAEQIEKEE